MKFRRTRARTLFSDFLARAVDPVVAAEAGAAWPQTKWQQKPIEFCTEVLGVRLTPKQQDIALSVRDGVKTATASGQKTGKTKIEICLALWFYCSFAGARVTMTANTKSQVRRVIWRELRETLRTSKVHIDGVLAKTPEGGFKAEDGREILGFTVSVVEAVSGTSGANMLFCVDEASALSPAMAEAIEGNMAGGAKMLWIGNPTRSEGPFFDAFHAKKEFWKTHELSSEEVAEWQEGEGIRIPGLANRATIETWALEYGTDSPFYQVRVLGKFLRNETGKVITLDAITRAQERYEEAVDEGILSIGLDPAGPGTAGDETAFAVVRGCKLLALFVFRGLTEDAIQTHLLGLLVTYRRDGEIPHVTIDSEGPIGSALFGRFRELSERMSRETPAQGWEVYAVKASSPARREPMIYERTREEVFAMLAKWMATGAIPLDHKLEAELHAPDWQGTVMGKLRLTSKEDLRAKLGRSPDRADALALAVWSPTVAWVDTGADERPEIAPYDPRGHRGSGQGVYESNEWWRT